MNVQVLHITLLFDTICRLAVYWKYCILINKLTQVMYNLN